jgi:hypothetical protein
VKYAHPLVLSALPQEIAMLAQNVQLDIIWIKTNVLPNVQVIIIKKKKFNKNFYNYLPKNKFYFFKK